MATTLKASSSKTTSATHPNKCQAGWSRCATGIVFQGADCGSDGSANNSICGGSAAGNTKTRAGVWIYGPLQAQTIGGTLCVTIRGNDNSFTNLYHPETAVYIMKPCGVKRHNVVCGIVGPACLLTNAAADYTFSASIVACATASAGDYLVMEAGYGGGCFICTCTGHIVDGSTGPHTRWVFSATIAVQTTVNNNQLMMTGMGT